MIIFGSIFTTFESSIIFGGSWGSIENFLKPKNQTTFGKFSLPKSVKHSVEQGSQTQSDSRAAWDSKKGLEGRIEKSEKNYLQISSTN